VRFTRGMKRTTDQNKLVRVAAILVIAAAEARAEETRRIVVSIPDRKLVLLEGDRIVKVYDVAVGKPSTPSPHGEFKIISHVSNPTWYGPEQTVAPGPENPIGTRWLGLSVKGYGIHGTNAPGSIGKAASHGCIRMRNRDVEELFAMVGVGVTVELLAEQVPQTFSTDPADNAARRGAGLGN
jgi:lipoprotein-anchoring transpeptidase ErfK/SrfK